MKININKERFNGENFVLDKERGVEGTLASNVKPWLKYYNIDLDTYSDEKKAYLDTNMNTYDYFLKVTKSYGDIKLLSYCGKVYTREDLISKVEEYIKKFNKMNIKRGDLFYAALDETYVGSEQTGVRPVVIIQNDIGNEYSPTVIIAPITSKAILN